MHDLANIQARDEIRATLAMQMQAYEERFGKVETLPIRIGDSPVEEFSIHIPGKPKAAKPSGDLRAQDYRRVQTRTQQRMEKAHKIRTLAETGIKIAGIAENTGLTPKYIMRILREHGIELVNL